MQAQVGISLGPEDLVKLEEILIDHDGEEALRFLKERIKRQVDEAARPHCGPRHV